MSIATQITRITNLRNRIRTKLIALGVISDTNATLLDCTEAIENMSGFGNLTKSTAAYTGSGRGVSSITFDVSTFLTDLSNVVFMRVRSTGDSWSTPSASTYLLFETFPNQTVSPQNYTMGIQLLSGGGGAFFNAGFTYSLSSGTLTVTGTSNSFIGNYTLECYHT